MSIVKKSLKNNDEVITTPYTFYATINAIVQADCRPNFVDSGKDFNINPDLIHAHSPSIFAYLLRNFNNKNPNVHLNEQILKKGSIISNADNPFS